MTCVTRRKKKFSDLPTRSRLAIIAATLAQLVLQGAALRDLWLRPDYLVRGSKRGWVAASFVNFFGPIAYFAWGRRTRVQSAGPVAETGPDQNGPDPTVPDPTVRSEAAADSDPAGARRPAE